MRALKCVTLIAMLAAVPTVAAQCLEIKAGAWDGPATASLSITPLAPQTRVGSPLRVKMSLKNTSVQSIVLWREKKGNGRVEVRDSSGGLVPDTKEGRLRNRHVDPEHLTNEDLASLLRGSGVCETVEPGNELTYEVDVSRLYDVNRPGRYTIIAEHSDPSNGKSLKSNTVTVTVTK